MVAILTIHGWSVARIEADTDGGGGHGVELIFLQQEDDENAEREGDDEENSGRSRVTKERVE
jgi:hypothetical protein